MSTVVLQLHIDPEISLLKFNREVQQLLSLKDDLRKRGWIIEKHEFPLVRITFIGRHILPRIAVCTVDIDFSNYDIIAPSVRFLDPFSFEPAIYLPHAEQLPANGRQSPIKGSYMEGGKSLDIILNHADNGLPFLCMPGVREYHEHPQHTNDPWQNHRKGFSGHILYYLLDRIDSYCVEPLKALTLNVNVLSPVMKLAHSHSKGQYIV
jgi:hypothetical protein